MFDKLKKLVTSMERYEKRVLLLLVLSALFNPFPLLTSLVTMYTPPFLCDLAAELHLPTENITVSSNVADDFLNFMIPMETDALGVSKRSQCTRYNRTWNDFVEYMSNVSTSNNGSENEGNIIECNHFNFDLMDGESSVATDYQLVCQKTWIKQLSIAIYVLGMAFGAISGGFLADWVGRYPIFLFFSGMQFSIGFVLGFSQNEISYCVINFFYGCVSIVNYYTAIMLGYELLQQKHRNLICSMMTIMFALGYMLFPLFTFLIRNWRYFCWAQLILGLYLIPYIWLLDESPRWLLAMGKHGKALDVLRKISKYNRKEFDESSVTKETFAVELSEMKIIARSWKCLLRHPTLIGRLVILAVCWSVSNLSYYAISLNTNSLSGDRFINCFLGGTVELLAYLVAFATVERFDRRRNYIFFASLTAAGIAASPFLGVGSGHGKTVTTLIAKLGASISFYVAIIITPEIFPTVLRSSATGIVSLIGRLSGFAIPLVMYSENILLPSLIVAGALIVSAGLCSLLPNSYNKPLPNTVEEALGMKRNWKGKSETEDIKCEEMQTMVTTKS